MNLPGLSALRSASYLRKWMLFGALIGVIAGLGAIAFVTGLHLATHVLLGLLAGYVPPAPLGEGGGAGSSAFPRPWVIPLITGIGGLLSGLAVFTLAPEAEGHGTDAAIWAFHHNPAGIRTRVSLVKIVASALTIGSGGSGGREGPTAQISAAFGSLLARMLGLTPADARIAVAVGIGSGIGAVFRAPLGGAVLGTEILYRDDTEVEALVPSFVASIVAFSIFGSVEGFTPIFGLSAGYQFQHPVELVYYALIGVAAGLMGILYARTFYAVAAMAARVPVWPGFRPALAAVPVGLLGLAIPAALGTGYGWLQKAMGADLLAVPLWMVLAVPFAKIASTALTIGSGGSGGIFGPGMVIGGFVGAAAWRLLAPIAPAVPALPAPFVVVGMMACFGSIAHAPLAVMLMVSEMTGTLALLPPAMVAVGLATLVVGETTIYRSQLATRADSPAHRFRFAMPILRAVPLDEVMSRPRLVLVGDTPADAALTQLQEAGLPGAPVVTAKGGFRGTVDRKRLVEAGDTVPVARLADPATALPADASLDDVLEALAMRRRTWVPIVDDGRVAGVVGMRELLEGYQRALRTSLRRLGGIASGRVLVEARVGPGSTAAEHAVEQVAWPVGTVLLSIQRGQEVLLAEGETVLKEGDVVSLLAQPDETEGLRLALAGPEEEPKPRPQGPEFV